MRVAKRLDISPVRRGGVPRRIEVCRHHAGHRVWHSRQDVVVGQRARADELDAGPIEPAFDELLGEGPALPGGNEYEDGVSVQLGGRSVTDASHQGGRKANYWRTVFRLALDKIAALVELASKPARRPPVPERYALQAAAMVATVRKGGL